MHAYLAEFVGTGVMVLLGTATVANALLAKTKGNGSGWMVITTGWAFAVYIGVLIAAPYSGAHLNPAVTLGLWVGGLFEYSRILPYIGAQFAGAFVGACLAWLAFKDHYNQTTEPGLILATFSTGPAINNFVMNVVTEVIATFVLVFAVFYFAVNGPTTAQGPVGLGAIGAIPVALIVWCLGLGLGGPTGYAINPARDLAPRMAHAILPIQHKGDGGWNYALVPVLAPVIGAVLAGVLFLLLGH